MITIKAEIDFGEKGVFYIDKKNLLSAETSIATRENLENPSYGIMSNGGNVKFKDYDGKIRNYASMNYLSSHQPLKIYIYETLSEKETQIGSFATDSWQYDNDKSVASVSFSDNLLSWQEINIDSLRIQPENNAYFFYEYLKGKTPTYFTFEELDETTKSYLESYYICFPYFYNQTLWSLWDNLCQACALHIYINLDGKVSVIHRF